MPISKSRRRRGRVAPGSSRSSASLSLNQTKKKTNWLYLSASLVIAILVIGGFVVGSGGFGTGAVTNKTGSSDEHVDGIVYNNSWFDIGSPESYQAAKEWANSEDTLI